MNPTEEAPPLPKAPFLAGDAALLVVAFFIGYQSEAPLATAPLVAIAFCVGLGAILAVIPFLVDHLRRQEAVLAERQKTLEALACSLAVTAEQTDAIAEALHTTAETVARSLKAAEQLPHNIQEKINLLNEVVAENENAEIEELRREIDTLRGGESEKLETALGKLSVLATDFAKTEAGARQQLAELNRRLAEFPAQTGQAFEKFRVALAAIPAGAGDAVPTASETTTEAEHPSPTGVVETETAPATDYSQAESANAAATSADLSPAHETEPPAAVKTKPHVAHPKPAKQRKERHDDHPGFFDEPQPDEAPPEPSRTASADGTTRLIATAYIGIGNKLYIRGEGPGLSWNKGTPLQFISIGKWSWEAADTPSPVKARLYKNDQLECVALGEITLDPGHQHAVTATF